MQRRANADGDGGGVKRAWDREPLAGGRTGVTPARFGADERGGWRISISERVSFGECGGEGDATGDATGDAMCCRMSVGELIGDIRMGVVDGDGAGATYSGGALYTFVFNGEEPRGRGARCFCAMAARCRHSASDRASKARRKRRALY